jgi:hypothetical protein
MALSPEKIQAAMRLAMQAGDQAAVADLRQRLADTYRTESQGAAVEGTGTLQRLREGIGQGMTNVARHAGNLVGLTSDEDLASAKERDAALLSTGAGKTGAFLGEVAATAPVGGLGLGAARAGAAKLGLGTATRFLAGTAGAGATQGAAEGALLADPGSRLQGAAIGGAAGAAIPAIGGAAWCALVRGVNPTKAARYLLNRGVDLTPGQMNPSGSLNMLEEAAGSLPFVGPSVKGARDASRTQWQEAAREVGLPPTMTGQAGKDAARAGLDPMYTGYETAYDVAKGFPTYPRQMRTAGGDVHLADRPAGPGSFTRAAQAPSVMAGNDARTAASAWLQDALTALKPNKQGLVDSGDLLKLRSNIRTQMRAAMQGPQPDHASAGILREAEQRVTEVLESQLPADALAKLRAADAQYAQYKILEDATRRAGDQVGGMTPAHLSAAVRTATPVGPYARGAGGPLRQLAKAGREVLDQRSPPTGARLATLAPVAAAMWKSPILAAPIAGLVGTQWGRKLLRGGTRGQEYGRELARALRQRKVTGKGLGTAYGAAAGSSAANEYGD